MSRKASSRESNCVWDKPVKACIWRSSRMCRPIGGLPLWFFEDSLPHLLLRNNSTVETMVGPVQLERPYFYCRRCRVGCYPFDEALGVVAGCKQLDMQQAVVHLVTEVPYDTAQSLFGNLTGMTCGSERMHTVTNQVGEKLTVLDVAPSREEILRRIASVSAGRFRRPVLVLGIDGAYVPTRPDSAREPQEGRRHTRAKRAQWRGQWRDAKGLRFYLLDGERIVHVLSWHQVQSDEQLGAALKQIKEAGVIPEEQVRKPCHHALYSGGAFARLYHVNPSPVRNYAAKPKR